MPALPNDRQLYVTGRLWHELAPQVDLTPFGHALHERIDLAHYGDGLRRFYFTFIAVTPDDEVNEPYHRYDAARREADVAVAIPFERAAAAGGPEMMRLMEAAYLQGVAQLKDLPLEGTFDVDRFRADVADLFAADDWPAAWRDQRKG